MSVPKYIAMLHDSSDLFCFFVFEDTPSSFHNVCANAHFLQDITPICVSEILPYCTDEIHSVPHGSDIVEH